MAKDRAIDKDRGERIKHVRTKVLKLQSQEKFAEVLSASMGYPLTRGAVGNWEQGKEIGIANMKAIAELADISLDWLAYNAGTRPETGGADSILEAAPKGERIPLVGYVRAGAAAYYYANASDPLDWVPPIEDGTDDTVAVQIQGESLGSFFDSWLVYYDEVRSPVTPDLIGKLCVVGLMDDRVVVKKIYRSRVKGLFDLKSNDGKENIDDVEVIWAARVKQMTPR